jgi:hypothetical protein
MNPDVSNFIYSFSENILKLLFIGNTYEMEWDKPVWVGACEYEIDMSIIYPYPLS